MGPLGNHPNDFMIRLRGKEQMTDQGHTGQFDWHFQNYLGEKGSGRRAALKPLYGERLFGTIKVDVVRCIRDGRVQVFADPVIPTKGKDKSKNPGPKSSEPSSLFRRLAMAAKAEREGGPSMEDAMAAMGDLPEFPFADQARKYGEPVSRDPSNLENCGPNVSPWKGTPHDYNLPQNTPRYIDSFERPYASFIFKYREQSWSLACLAHLKSLTLLVDLEKELAVSIDQEEEKERKRTELMAMEKEELIKRLMEGTVRKSPATLCPPKQLTTQIAHPR